MLKHHLASTAHLQQVAPTCLNKKTCGTHKAGHPALTHCACATASQPHCKCLLGRQPKSSLYLLHLSHSLTLSLSHSHTLSLSLRASPVALLLGLLEHKLLASIVYIYILYIYQLKTYRKNLPTNAHESECRASLHAQTSKQWSPACNALMPDCAKCSRAIVSDCSYRYHVADFKHC